MSSQFSKSSSFYNDSSTTEPSNLSTNYLAITVYHKIGLSGILNFKAFEQAFWGYQQLSPAKQGVLSVIDFTLPSTEKRLVVIDMIQHKVLYHTIVSHGEGSGKIFAESFSNIHESFQSSLGFFETAETYQGKNGYSLNIDGLEKGINDQARARRVVIHAADYCSEAYIREHGFLGLSQGCPALPKELNTEIINIIKDGSLLYIFADRLEYLEQSRFFLKFSAFPLSINLPFHLGTNK